MSYQQWLAVAAILIAPMTTSAQSNPPEKAETAAAAPTYQSAFTGYQSFTEDEETPDIKWRAVNEEMAQLGGHAGHLKGGATDLSGPSEQLKSDAKPADTAVDHSKHH